MKKTLSWIIGGVLLIAIIVIGIILGMPKEEKKTSFMLEEPILYIKSHATTTNNTDFETLNNNYLNILKKNGLDSTDISMFIEANYTQQENLYIARFISDYGDTYVLGFNLNTNQVALKRLSQEEVAKEALELIAA